MDVGLILKENSLDIDISTLEDKVATYINYFNKSISREVRFLTNNKVDIIVSDIVPWIFKVSNKLNIPSIFISNFIWIEIYKEHLSNEIVNEYKECYKLADKALFYELYMED